MVIHSQCRRWKRDESDQEKGGHHGKGEASPSHARTMFFFGGQNTEDRGGPTGYARWATAYPVGQLCTTYYWIMHITKNFEIKDQYNMSW